MIWSQLKKRVEALLLPEFQGRVELRSTNYRGAHDDAGRGYITLDGIEIWSMSDLEFFKIEYGRINAGESQDTVDDDLLAQGICSQAGFYRSLEAYLNSSVDENLEAKDMVRRALSMLDRRVGKRRLSSMDITNEHPVVQQFYVLRNGLA